jgi:L-asparaginase II
LQTGQYYKAKQCSGSSLITVGDNITITEVAGGATESYEVVETTIIANEGRMMLVLGDYEKNNFTSLIISTNGINKTIT